MKQQELDTTKSLFTQSHEKIEQLEKKLKDANIGFDRLQEDIKRFVKILSCQA
jgi:hemerythrin superfamily protein